MVWDGFRRLKRIPRNITIMPLTAIESGLSGGGAAMCMEEKATARHIEAPCPLGGRQASALPFRSGDRAAAPDLCPLRRRGLPVAGVTSL